ncbi:MFS transporter [Brevibacillus reuszeri]|uniref:MFS transporter n=1 Tax=Brevibacillus reuszeri TaxID=54915 RepID=UPI001B1C3A4F|nr:MFS transporter [Brevibacillus reuszeri]GIO08955.1 MFS transporter [Brevibacillus reuszeri]
MTNQAANKKLWRNSSFALLWCGTILSAMADGAFFILLSWFIVDVTGSEAMLGTTLICMSIPRLLFMLAGGVAADRWNRKWIMFLSILSRGIILVGFSLLLTNESNSFLPISAYVLAVLFGTVDAFFWPARSSILPSLVTREQLAPANSMMEISQQISMVGGPVVSALLIKTTTYPVMFLILGAAFFAGTLFILSLRLNPSEQESMEREPAAAKTSYLKDIMGGIRFTFSVPILCIIFVTSLFTNMMFSGPINMGIPLHVKDLGWDGSSYSSLSLSLGIGTIVGGILTGLWKGFRGKFILLPVILGFMGVGMSSLFFMQQLTFGLISMFLIGMTLTMTNIPLITYIQSIVPANVLGRVMSLLSLMSIGFGPVSYALCSYLLEAKMATPGLLLFSGGIIFTCIGLSLLFIPAFRKMEQHPDWKRTTVETPSASTSLSS